MLDWLKKLGGGQAFENKAGLDAKSLELLAEDFGPLDELAPSIGTRVTRFLVDGAGDEVLAEIATLKQASEKMRLRCAHQFHVVDGITPRSEFFKSVRCGSPEFFRRLGLAYEACTRQARVRIFRAFGDPKLDWLEILLIEATQLSINTWPRRCRECPALTAELLEAMIALDGFPRELLVRAAFLPHLQRFMGPDLEPVFEKLAGLGQSAVRHAQVLLSVLDHTDFKQRVYALTMMKKCKVPSDKFMEKLVELALDSSRQVREQAELMLADFRPAARPLIERKVVEGTNEEKALGAQLLWAWEGEAARKFLQSRLAEEKNRKVLRAIEDLLAVAATPSTPVANVIMQLPALAPMPSHAPLEPETERAWQECFQKVNAAIASHNASQTGNQQRLQMTPVSSDAVRKSFTVMQTGGKNEAILNDLYHTAWQREVSDPIREFWQRPELNLVHLVRFLIHIAALRMGPQYDRDILNYGGWLEHLMPAFRRAHPEGGLRELGAAFMAAGLDAARIGHGLLRSYHEMLAPLGLLPGQIWPYWADHLDLLEQAFGPASAGGMNRYYQRYARRNAFHALATFPLPPERLTQLLWKLALGPRSERLPAQRCLEGLPDKFERLTNSLSAGDGETRLAAAEWLGRSGDARAVEALLAALKREKNEATKGAMMSALELLGASVEALLNRSALLKEAEKGAAKGVPEDLKWFPFERLPVVHWVDNGKRLAPVIVQWWLIRGFKLKNPEPSPLLRKYCASLKCSEREALGQFVLQAWLGEDTTPISRAEAEQRAHRLAQQFVLLSQTSVWPQNKPKKTLEGFYEDILPGFLIEPKASAISSKGVLSVVGACIGAEAAPIVGQYVKQWYGMRVAQCRALLQMLGWVEHKTATQLLLAVGTRFRTKSIQEEASKQARALAERKGWTLAELADRTIPTAGLDDKGVLTLDFGPRQFEAKLNEDLEFALTDADGKSLKGLPEPRNDDDEAMATQSKRAFSAAKKEVKSILTMQRERLYEAMCAQRVWPCEDWSIYLNRHPIVRHHCQRLVWAVIRDEKTVLRFRPLPDGSFTDASDDPVALQPNDFVRIAHECHSLPEQSLAWRQHLKDYEVEPLFEQFGRPNFALGEERKQEDELTDFRGHLVEAFRLRGRAAKLGYTRGQSEDGGRFYAYHKRIPTMGMEAVIGFTGNSLPEENHTVAVTTLCFQHLAVEGGLPTGGAKMPLGEVPPVLLSECWNDIRQIAAEGAGFDPDWEKKAEM